MMATDGSSVRAIGNRSCQRRNSAMPMIEETGAAARITVLLADDHTILRQGIRTLLETQPDMEVVGEATNGREAVEQARRLRPLVILMDISMPLLNGLEATRQIKKELPACQVVVLTMHENEEYLVNILQAGATGYVLKQAADRELIEAVRIASRGDTYLYPRIARLLVTDYLRRFGSCFSEVGGRSINRGLSFRRG